MTNKKMPFWPSAARRAGLGLCLCLFAAAPVCAQEAFDFDDIDSLLEENTLTDVSNRYAAVLQSYLPERAARLGNDSANARLNVRTAQERALTLRALQNVREQLKEVNVKNLSAGKQTDFELLQNALESDIRRAAEPRETTDPLYYAEAFDAVYDVYLNSALSPSRKRADLTARLKALENTAEQAEANLTAVNPYLAQLAMEKAYYAYLAFDEIADFRLESAQDDITAAQTKRENQEAKRAVKRMFDLFKYHSQQESGRDFRLGEEAYAQLLEQDYQITQTPDKLIKNFEKNTLAARQNLSAALEPFLEQMNAEEITLVEDSNSAPTTQTIADEKSSKKKTKKGKPAPRNAQDFYAVAKRITSAQADADPAASTLRRANDLETLLTQQNALPAKTVPLSVRTLPQYYAYTQAYQFRPAYGAAPGFFLRLPAGNRQTRAEQLARDFNEPVRKLTVSSQLVPGLYYQNAAGRNWSVWRGKYPSASTQQGWAEYAKWLAKEQKYIVTDEDLLFYAWDEYRRALAAETDAKLQTKRFSYANALEYLTRENGFEQEEAETLLKTLAARPGEAAGRQIGFEAWVNAHEKFRKKQGKKFNEADFHLKAVQTGNVPPAAVEKEIERLYQKDKQKKKDLF